MPKPSQSCLSCFLSKLCNLRCPSHVLIIDTTVAALPSFARDSRRIIMYTEQEPVNMKRLEPWKLILLKL